MQLQLGNTTFDQDTSEKLPVSGGIKMSILMPPETGNWAADLKKLPVSGGIRMSILMPPETGN